MRDELESFERWLPDHLMMRSGSEFSHNYLFRLDEDGCYDHDFVRHMWEGWHGRASHSTLHVDKTP
jgi:hypothetical protein